MELSTTNAMGGFFRRGGQWGWTIRKRRLARRGYFTSERRGCGTTVYRQG
jgi:hypothetical protein